MSKDPQFYRHCHTSVYNFIKYQGRQKNVLQINLIYDVWNLLIQALCLIHLHANLFLTLHALPPNFIQFFSSLLLFNFLFLRQTQFIIPHVTFPSSSYIFFIFFIRFCRIVFNLQITFPFIPSLRFISSDMKWNNNNVINTEKIWNLTLK